MLEEVSVAVYKDIQALLMHASTTTRIEDHTDTSGRLIPDDASTQSVHSHGAKEPTATASSTASVSSTSANASALTTSADDHNVSAASIKEDVFLTVFYLPCRILMLLNFFRMCKAFEANAMLRKSFYLKEAIAACLELCLSPNITEKLRHGIVPLVQDMPVFIIDKSFSLLDEVVAEVNAYIAKQQKKESDALAEAAAIEEARAAMEREKNKTAKELRDEKRQRYVEQRKQDAIYRQKVSQQRNLLYQLIQSDQKTEIFKVRAAKPGSSGAGMAGGSATWGGDITNDFTDTLDAFDTMATEVASRAATADGGSRKGTPSSKH